MSIHAKTYAVEDADAGTNPDEPMTEVQAARLRELAEQAGEPFDGNLTQRQAARRIAYLKELSD